MQGSPWTRSRAWHRVLVAVRAGGVVGGLAGAYCFGAIVSGLALICAAAVVPSSAGRSAPDRLDHVGAVLLALALVTGLVAVAEGTQWGWGSPCESGRGMQRDR